MKKIFFSIFILIFFSLFFFSCKETDFNLQANVNISEDFISRLLEGHELFAEGVNDFDYSFCGIDSAELKELLKAMGAFKGFVDVNLTTQFNGFSLKKIYAKKDVMASGYVSFENEIPQKPIEAYENFVRENPDTSMKLNFHDDKKGASYSYVFPVDSYLYDNERSGGEGFDVSAFCDKGNHSKKQKNLSVKFRGGKIIINPAKGIEGLDAEIVISKIKS
ncbi:MAG: hypothetical protein K2N58_11370 [Treponemataceae bacterium]|nr:hypothetical protein [Treponemataceae bacterium]